MSRASSTLKGRFIPLRYRLIGLTCCLLVVSLGVLAVVLGVQQSRAIRQHVEAQGIAIARGISSTSLVNLVTYNYLALEQAANQAENEPYVAAVIIHDKEGRVAGFSGRPELQGKVLTDGISARAIAATEPLIQETALADSGQAALDVAIPAFMPDSMDRWGTVRVVLSLGSMHEQIRRTTTATLLVGMLALGVGAVASVLAARRLTDPLGRLARATVEGARGNLELVVEVATNDEVGVLAENFSAMIHEIVMRNEGMRRQMAEISHLQRYLANVLDTMNEGLVSVAVDGRVATLSPTACKVLGLQALAPQGGRFSETLGPFKAISEHITRALETGSVEPLREVAIDRGDERRFLLMSSSFLLGEGGERLELVLTLLDITELKTLEEQLRRSERLAALGVLASSVAHEIRNPLTAIKTFTANLSDKLQRPGFVEKFERHVPSGIRRIELLAENLLELSRQPRYHFTAVDVADLIRFCLEFVEQEMTERGISCRIALGSSLPAALADPDQLEKVFLNLAQNAAHAMPDGGVLEIEAGLETTAGEVGHADSGTILIAFCDTGPGIPEALMQKIFEPFFSTKGGKGTGLGLAITRKIVEEHGGTIRAMNRPAGGARFEIRLPAASEAALALAESVL